MSLNSPNFAGIILRPGKNIQREEVRNVDEMILICANVAEVLERASFTEHDVFGVRLALEECIANSLKHGNCEDPGKAVRVRYSICDEVFEVEIEDDGPGFDPTSVPDPLAPENLEKPSGRGIFLMRHYMDFVEYNRTGNCVRMRKKKSRR